MLKTCSTSELTRGVAAVLGWPIAWAVGLSRAQIEHVACVIGLRRHWGEA
jgi:hypothetical protein